MGNSYYQTSHNEEWETLNPTVQQYWIVKGILTITMFTLLVFFPYLAIEPSTLTLIILFICLGISYFIVVIWAGLFFERYLYCIKQDGVYINRGIWFKSNRRIPYERIQHISVTRGPLEILFGIHDLNIFTAGTGSMGSSAGSRGMFGAEGFIPGLTNPKILEQEIWNRVQTLKSGDGLGRVSQVVDHHTMKVAKTAVELDMAILEELRMIRTLLEEYIKSNDKEQ